MKTNRRLCFSNASTALILVLTSLSGTAVQASRGTYERFTLLKGLSIVGTQAYMQKGVLSQTKPKGESCMVSHGPVFWTKQSGFAPVEAAKGVAKFFGMFLWGEGLETSHITLKSELSDVTRGVAQGHVTVQPGAQVQQLNALFTSTTEANGTKALWFECPSIASASQHLAKPYFSSKTYLMGDKETALNGMKAIPIAQSEAVSVAKSVNVSQHKAPAGERNIAGFSGTPKRQTSRASVGK